MGRFAFAFDIDGVLLRSSRALRGATATLRRLQQQKIPFILLTNGGGHSERSRIATLSQVLDVPLEERQLIQSHTPWRDHPARYGYKNVLVSGGKYDVCRRVAEEDYGFAYATIPFDLLAHDHHVWPYHSLSPKEQACTRPLKLDTPIDAVYVYHDPRDWGLDSTVILDILRGQSPWAAHTPAGTRPAKIPVYFSNPDILWASAYAHGPRLGQGAFRELLKTLWRTTTEELRYANPCDPVTPAVVHDRTATAPPTPPPSPHPAAADKAGELEYVQYGKPTTATYSYAHDVLLSITRHLHPPSPSPSTSSDSAGGGVLDRVYMIGDNPSSDILGARHFAHRGWIPILVSSGVYRGTYDQAVARRGEIQARHLAEGVGEAVDWALRQEDRLA